MLTKSYTKEFWDYCFVFISTSIFQRCLSIYMLRRIMHEWSNVYTWKLLIAALNEKVESKQFTITSKLLVGYGLNVFKHTKRMVKYFSLFNSLKVSKDYELNVNLFDIWPYMMALVFFYLRDFIIIGAYPEIFGRGGGVCMAWI